MLSEDKYGDVSSQLNAGFSQSTGATLQNYIAENQKMDRDRNYLNMMNPDYELDYQENFKKLTLL